MMEHATAALDPASRLRANRKAIVTMIAAMACFVVNDALVKFVSQTMPAGQLIFIRGLMACGLVLAGVLALGATARVSEVARGWIAVRAIVDALAATLYLISLFHMPISTATAINMTSPLLITVLAALLLGERVGIAPWLATGIGFAGVLLIVQPRPDGGDPYAIVCLVAVVLVSLRDLITRRVEAAIPSVLITLSNTIAVTLLAGAISVVGDWSPVHPVDFGLLAVAAVFLTAGYYLIVSSTRRGDLSAAAPFRYTGLLFATIIGFVVWGEVPNALAWFGVVLLVGSGIYVLRASRRARAADPAPD
jgi:drug/metabolite transporter (DMT)-like permease